MLMSHTELAESKTNTNIIVHSFCSNPYSCQCHRRWWARSFRPGSIPLSVTFWKLVKLRKYNFIITTSTCQLMCLKYTETFLNYLAIIAWSIHKEVKIFEECKGTKC